MVVLWRTLLIVLCSVAVMICYPNYPEEANKIVWTLAAIAFLIMLVTTIILHILVIGRIKIFNILLDCVLIVVYLYFLLNIFPQLDGKTPYSKLKKGIYPTSQDIDNGLYNLGLSKKSNTLQEFQEGIIEVSDNVNEVKDLILKEHKD